MRISRRRVKAAGQFKRQETPTGARTLLIGLLPVKKGWGTAVADGG